jgi:hypothetical protein
MWMAIRNSHTSTGQQLINSWSCNLEDAHSIYLDVRKDQFLHTANQYDDVVYAVSELSFNEQRVYEAEFRNLLFNSSFGIEGIGRLQKPEGWTTRRNSMNAIKFYKDESLWGTQSLKLDGPEGHCELTQSRDFTASAGRLNASIYVKSIDVDSSVSTAERYVPDTAGILLVVKYADLTVHSFGVGFPKNTEDNWVRASFSVELIGEVSEFEFIIINRTDTVYLVDLPQVEANSRASSWTYSSQDVPIHSGVTRRSVGGVQVLFNTGPSQVVKKVELLPLATENEFKETIIPTRIESFSPDQDQLATFSITLGRQINAFRETMATNWIVEDNQIVEKASNSNDRFGSHLPVELYIAEDGERYVDTTALSDSSVEIKATTVYKNWIVAVSKETYSSMTRYFLKFLQPYKVNYEDNFLQSSGDIELKLDLGTNFGDAAIPEEVTRVGICKNIPQAIFIDTDLDRRFYFKLKYDYFYADFSRRQIFCRENYVAQNGLLQVI